MLLLAACTEDPAIPVPAILPTATHASALPATDFLGPRAVEGVPKEHLCGGDRVELLREGVFGWRVLGHEDPDERRRWAAADAAYERACDTPFPTRRLLALGAAETGEVARSAWFLDDGTEMFLLVDDPAPDAPLPPVSHTRRRTYTLQHGSAEWTALGMEADLAPAQGLTAAQAAHLAAENGADVWIAVDPRTDWATFAAAIDAAAAEGLPRPTLGLAVSSGDAPEETSLPVETRPMRASDTVAVLALGRVGYVQTVDP